MIRMFITCDSCGTTAEQRRIGIGRPSLGFSSIRKRQRPFYLSALCLDGVFGSLSVLGCGNNEIVEGILLQYATGANFASPTDFDLVPDTDRHASQSRHYHVLSVNLPSPPAIYNARKSPESDTSCAEGLSVTSRTLEFKYYNYQFYGSLKFYWTVDYTKCYLMFLEKYRFLDGPLHPYVQATVVGDKVR